MGDKPTKTSAHTLMTMNQESTTHILRSPQRGKYFRVEHIPGTLPTACLLLNSGRVTLFDGPQSEVGFFSKLKQALNTEGINIFEFDQPVQTTAEPASFEEDVDERCLRISQVLQSSFFQPYAEHYALVGLSRGGQAILNFITGDRPFNHGPTAVCLLSTVIEQPSFIQESIFHIDLIYGARDVIAYAEGENIRQLVNPEEYAKTSKRFLIRKKNQTVDTHILPGVGHFMKMVSGQRVTVGAEKFISKLVLSSLLKHPRNSKYTGEN